MFLIFVMYCLSATTFPLGKLILQYVEPIFFIGIRMILSGLLLLGFRKYIQKKSLLFKKQDVGLFAAAVLFHIYVSYVFEFIALKTMHAAKVAMFYNFMPFITALVLYLLYGKKVSKKQFLGLIIGFVGMMLLLIPNSNQEVPLFGSFFISWAEVFLLMAVIGTSVGWIIVQKLLQKGYSSLHINGIAMFFGGISSLITSVYIEGLPMLTYPSIELFPQFFEYLQSISSVTIARLVMLSSYIILIMIIGNIIVYNLYSYLLKTYSPTFMSFAGFMTPMITALIGWVLLGETVTYHFFLALAFVTVGLWIFYFDEKK